MLYRYSLGRYPDTDQLIPDGDFNTFCGGANWTCGANWLIGGGVANYNAAWAITGSLLYSNPGVFTVGKRYRIIINLAVPNPDMYLMIYCGDYTVTSTSFWCDIATITIETNCINNTLFAIRANARYLSGIQNIDIMSVEAYEMLCNQPLADQPAGKTKKSYKKSELINGCYVTFIEQLTFFGDGYTYLRNLANTDFTFDVPVKVEYFYLGVWTTYFLGIIYLSEVTWERDTVLLSVEDSVISKLIRKKLDFRYNIFNYDQKALTVANRAYEMVFCHDPASGLYNGPNANILYNVFRLLRQLIHEATGLDVTLTSDLLTIGDFMYLGISKGWNLYVNNISPFTQQDGGMDVSIGELLTNLNALLNIGMISTVDANGIPALKIEYLKDFRDGSSTFNMINVNNTNFTYTTDLIPITVKCGYKINNLKSKNADCSTIYVSHAKIADGELDFSSDWLQDTAIMTYYIQTIPASGTEYLDSVFWVQYYKSGGNYLSLRWIDVYPGAVTPAPGWYYNPTINDDDNMYRHLTTLVLDYLKGAVVYPATGLLLKRLFEFEYPLTFAELAILDANPLQKLVITGYEDLPEAYIEEFEFDNENQMVKFKIIAE